MLKIGSLGLRFIYFILLVIFSKEVHAQQNYTSGYIIDATGDTIRGHIDYWKGGKNPQKIYFKKDLTSESIKYLPSDIKAFVAEENIYISAIVDRSLSAIRVNKLDYHDKLNLRRDTLFLQTVVQGPKSLYYHKSEVGIENFYIGDGENITLLEYKKYIKSIDQKDIIAEVRTYTLQLKEYFEDCQAIQGNLASLKYNGEKIENLFFNYYEKCLAETPNYIKRKEKIAFSYSAKAGISYTKINFESAVYSYLSESNYKPSIDYTLGIGADIGLSRNNKGWSLNNDLLFTRYEVKGVYTHRTNSDNYRVINTTLGFSYIKLHTLLKYKYKTEKGSSIYFNAGISHGLIIKKVHERLDEVYTPAGQTIEEGLAVPGVRNLERGRVLGVGWQKNNYSIELRYERGSGVSTFSQLGNVTRRFYLLGAYEFN